LRRFERSEEQGEANKTKIWRKTKGFSPNKKAKAIMLLWLQAVDKIISG
jgi:hypothetical protein